MMISSVFEINKAAKPKLSVDFKSAVLPSLVSFSRAGNTATVVDPSGAIVLVNADTPRFSYLDGSCLGLLVESSSENLLLNSVFAGAVAGSPGTAPTNWLNLLSTGTIASVGAGIYAAGNAVRITHTNLRRAFYQVRALAANTTYTYSATVTVHSTPAAGFPRISDCVNINPAALPVGTTVSYILNGNPAAPSTAIPDGQTSKIEIIIAVAATGGIFEMRWGLGLNGNIEGDVSIQMPQLEVGSRATSYIPTTTTSVVRAADDATITGANFDSFWQAGKGAALVRARPSFVSGVTPVLQFDDTTADNIIALRGNTTNPELYVRAGGADQAQINAGTIAANTSYRLAGAWATDNCAASLNSGTVVTDAAATIPVVTQARLGSDGTNYLNGHIEAIEYYDERVTNATLQKIASAKGYRSILQPVFRNGVF